MQIETLRCALKLTYFLLQARQISPPVTSSISFVKKSERLSHKFNICGTPSSSPVDTSHGNKNPMLNSKLPSGSLRYAEEFSDDSPNHSEDEDLLTECIQSAMPKVSFKNNKKTYLDMFEKILVGRKNHIFSTENLF